MAANEHKNLTDVNRHNPKGFESAFNDTLCSKSTGTGAGNTDGSLIWTKKNLIKTDTFNIQGYAVLSNANYHYGTSIPADTSSFLYSNNYGSGTVGESALDVGTFFKTKSLVMHSACNLNKIYLWANATTAATITVALCKITFVAGNTGAIDPVLLNELTITGQSSNDNLQVTRNLTPETTLAAGDVLFAMVKASTAATTYFKLAVEVGYDN
jgi:hypothetical protein